MQEFTVQLFDDGSAQIGGTGANLELRFGYSKNAHMYSVKFIRSEEWEDLYIRVHFHPEADIYDVDPVLAQNNIVNIPAMITSMPGEGKLTIEGTDGYKTITSADIPYRVSENSGIDSDTDPEPGESSFQQFVDAVKEDAKSAEQAAKDAESALAETKKAASLALTDIETARTNAISDIEKIESEVKGEIQEDVNSAKSYAEAASKSAEEAKSAADSAKKSLSDLETAKESALSEISKEKDTSVSAVGSAKETALTELSKSASSSIQNVKAAETNAIDAIKDEGSSQKTALSNASNAALTSIDTAKQSAVKAVEDKASEKSSAIDEKAASVIQSVQNAGDAEILAISEATTSGIEQITQSAGQHLTQIDSAAGDAVQDIMDVKEDSLDEFEAVNAHPPIQNPETGKWQVWNAETLSYVDTEYDWEGGWYSPTVDGEGNLTWEGSKEGMQDIPSSNIRGPQGLGVPTPSANDYGKAPTVNAAGTGYELTGPYAPLSAAIIETAKGNPAVCEDSVEWPLQGMRVYGKSTQVSTTGAQLFPLNEAASQNGFTVTHNEDGTINITGTPRAQWVVVLSTTITLQPGTYYLSSTSKGSSAEGQMAPQIRFIKADGSAKYVLNTSFTVEEQDEYDNVALSIQYRNATLTEVNLSHFFVMLNAGSTALPFEPYTGGKPSPSPEYPQEIVSAGDDGEINIALSDSGEQSQSLTFSTPNGLPGIPVDSGGNFVDADGQQWICDEIDFARGVYVQNIGCVTINNTFNWKQAPTSDASKFYYRVDDANIFVDFELPNNSATKANGFCDNFTILSGDKLYLRLQNGIAIYKPTSLPNGLISCYMQEFETSTVEKFKDYIKQHPFKIALPLKTPIETPIPADELAAYRALHTYDGTTVITPDDALAQLEVDYIVKPKAYIEKKLTAIETRLNALEISEALEGE